MKSWLNVLLFIALAIFCWGVYGPVLQLGQADMHGGLRPFICVGLAYFAIAVVVPIVLLRMFGEKGRWTGSGLFWSLVAGAAGAIGALGVILAMGARGSPLYVMPIVFGSAPVVNSFLTIYLAKSFKQVGPVFIAGLILVIAGSAVVLMFAPSPGGPKVTINTDAQGGISLTAVTKNADGSEKTDNYTAKNLAELESNFPVAYNLYRRAKPLDKGEFVLVCLFTIMTSIAWGLYGPTLHKGQTAMGGSRLRPFLCVGLAYFLIAVIVPAMLLAAGNEPKSSFTWTGSFWSLAGGATGAIGAIGIIMAFNFGGKPVYVMPLVFGGAPVINTFVSLAKNNAYGQIGSIFIAGLILVAVGAVTVLVFAPRGPAHAEAAPAKKPEPKPAPGKTPA